MTYYILGAAFYLIIVRFLTYPKQKKYTPYLRDMLLRDEELQEILNVFNACILSRGCLKYGDRIELYNEKMVMCKIHFASIDIQYTKILVFILVK